MGAKAAPPRPLSLLDDGLTPSLTVLLMCDNGTVLWRHRRQFISSNMVLRIFNMIATSGFLAALEQIRFRYLLAPLLAPYKQPPLYPA